MTFLIQSQYEPAIQTFKEFLEKYPDDLESDNAEFWIGHAYFQMEKFTQAERFFRNVLKYYSHRPTEEGHKTPDAIYMLGKMLLLQGFSKKAAYYFEQTILSYPDSAAAQNAKESLKGIKP